MGHGIGGGGGLSAHYKPLFLAPNGLIMENVIAQASSFHFYALRMCEGIFAFLPNDSWADPPQFHDPSLGGIGACCKEWLVQSRL